MIYLVDDDPLVTRSLLTALRLETPWRVASFESAAAALEAMGQNPPDVVISDFKMPVMDGLELLRAVRQRHPDAVLMLLTGYADKDAAVQAINEVGIWQFVEKPWDLGDLLQKIRTGIEKRGLELALRRTARDLEVRNRELERSLEELARAQERLVESERLAAVGRVASGIAHELGNQLSLVGYAELIAKRARDQKDGETLEHAEILVATQRRLMTMVSEIKDFAKNRAASYGREPLDVASAMDDALGILRYDQDVRRVRVRRDGAAHAITVGHAGKLAQVLINLIRNAAQASSPGGEVVVTLADVPDGVVVEVADRGSGMTPSVLEHLGEPFYTTKGDVGTGLGLGIARRIVAEHGGTLEVRSSAAPEDHGTTVTVRLPPLGTGAPR